MGKVGFSPIIGLAVVVALALAAVFGAMSLTNPAFAAIGQPADAELTERTFSPQDASTSVAMGEGLSYDISSLITGGGDNFDEASVECVPGCSSGNPITGTPSVAAGFSAVNLIVGATNVANVGRVRMTITVELNKGDDQEIVIDVEVTPVVNEEATVIQGIPDQRVTIRTSVGGTPAPDSDSVMTTIDLADYFMDGRGNGVITEYAATQEPTGILTFDPVDGNLDQNANPSEGTELGMFVAADGMAQLVAVTIQTTDGNTAPADTDPSITFFVNVVMFVEPPGAVTGLVAERGDGSATLMWADPDPANAAITNYEWRAMIGDTSGMWNALIGDDLEDRRDVTIVGLTNGVTYTFQVRAIIGVTPGDADTSNEVTPMAPRGPVAPSLAPGGDGAGSTTSYTVEFQVRDDDDTTDIIVNTREDDLIIEFHEDYSVPATIRNTSVAITTDTEIAYVMGETPKDEVTFTPEDVTVDGNEIFISVGDIDERDDKFEYTFAEGDVISVPVPPVGWDQQPHCRQELPGCRSHYLWCRENRQQP